MAKTSHAPLLDALGRRIVEGDLTTGTVVRLADLEATYGVSRTVVREAVRVLEAMSMVRSKRRIGVIVLAPEEWNALDTRLLNWQLTSRRRNQQLVVVTEFRSAIEPTAARLAALRATAAQRNELVDLAERMETLGNAGEGNGQEYLDADLAFHNLILLASGNLMLAAARAPIGDVIAARVHLGLAPDVPYHDALHNHLRAAEAIARGDADAAENYARGYVSAVLSEVRVG